MYLIGGLEGLSLVAIVDALERRAVAAWVLSGVLFLGGVALVLPMFAGGEEGIGSLGWMTWGAVGATFGAGFWLAGIPYRRRPAGRVLRLVAVLAATAPIALHLVGVL